MPVVKTFPCSLIVVIFFGLISNALADLTHPYQKVMISLDVEGEQALFIMLASDGTVNRLGTGKLKNDDPEMYIGTSGEPLFEKFMEKVPGYIFDHQGIYDFSDKKGEICILTIIFESENDSDAAGFRFDYGYESGGPPEDILNILNSGVEVTNPWYDSQRRK